MIAVIGLATSGGGSNERATPSAAPISQPAAAPAAPIAPSGPIRIETPPLHSEKAAKDWGKILEHIEEGRFSNAKRKLWEWERKHADGATPETEALRTQLEQLGPDRHEED